MIQFTTIREATDFILQARAKGQSIGFVPTMGALHEGHLGMVRQGKKENDLVVVSIFVNPVQFNNRNDLDRYPRTPEKDIRKLVCDNCDILFLPPEDEMYPGGEVPEVPVDLGDLGDRLEGAFRPGHFKGVAIVVNKLFDIIRPDRAYFGKKDYQQLRVIEFMTDALGLPVKVIPAETVREADGLAMSSRNVRLNSEQRAEAPKIYETLQWVKAEAGTVPPGELARKAFGRLAEIPGARPEYLEIVRTKDLAPLGSWNEGNAVVLTAVFMGDVRLIDNLELFS